MPHVTRDCLGPNRCCGRVSLHSCSNSKRTFRACAAEGDEATDQAERERRYGTPAPTGAARALATTTVAHLARQSGGGCCFLSTDHILYELKSAVMDRERSACWGKTAHLVAGELGAEQQVAVDAEAPREPAALSVITGAAHTWAPCDVR